jgi:NitT/TauT family transport system substrate-binding protein
MIERRAFVKGLAAAGTGLLGHARATAADPPPETPRIRLGRMPEGVDVACFGPMWVAEDLLRAEAFTRIEYPTYGASLDELAAGKHDILLFDIPEVVLALDEGKAIVVLGGIHGGCYELFGSQRVKSVGDLRGMKVGVTTRSRGAFVAAMASYVGLKPQKELTFEVTPNAYQRFVDGSVDAFLGFPPEPQKLRARKVGRSLVNTATDRPWSQHFCCMAIANRAFVHQHPVATKRALRALVKATDLCAAEPERVAREIVRRGFIKEHDLSLQAIREIPYRRWREYDSADTVRFFALRMHEAGIIKTNPQKLIADGANWRFVNELKKELKG